MYIRISKISGGNGTVTWTLLIKMVTAALSVAFAYNIYMVLFLRKGGKLKKKLVY